MCCAVYVGNIFPINELLRRRLKSILFTVGDIFNVILKRNVMLTKFWSLAKSGVVKMTSPRAVGEKKVENIIFPFNVLCQTHDANHLHMLTQMTINFAGSQNRNQSGYGISQWETTLHNDVVSHWLSPYPQWSLENLWKPGCSLLHEKYV